MGKLLQLEACPVCNYHVEGPLHYGGSTRSRLFIYYRYEVAQCHACQNIVSVLVPTPEYDIEAMLKAAHRDIETLKTMVEQGDPIARRLLPLHELALEDDAEDETLEMVETGLCTACGSEDITLFLNLGGDEGEHFADGSAWLACPACEDGKIWVRTMGTWDELDSGL